MRAKLALTVPLILSLVALCQDHPYNQIRITYLIQATELVQNGFGDVDQFCVSVQPDGKFHMEKGGMGSYGAMKPKIYEGQLSDAELEGLRNILAAEDFKKIKVIPKPTMEVTRMTGSMTVNVHDGIRSQSFFVSTEQQAKEFKDSLKPFRSWLTSMKRKKLPEMKNAESNACSGGIVMPQ